MVMMNNLKKITALFLLAAFLGLPIHAQAQDAAPGTGATTAHDYLQQVEANTKKELENLGTDTGSNYGITDSVGDAVSETLDDIKNCSGFWGCAWSVISAPTKVVARTVGNAVEFGGGDIMTYTNPETGETVEYVKTVWGTEAQTTGNLKGCPPIAIQIVRDSNCIFCPLFAVLYDAANEMSSLSFSKLGAPMATVMLIGFALFIAFKVLAHVSALTKQDAPKFLGELLTQAFKVLIAFILLMNSNQVYQYFISPVLNAGLDFGAAMLFENPTAFANCTAGINIPNDTALLPIKTYARLDCFIRAIQAEIAVMQSIGSSLMCVGRNKASTFIGGIWDFGMVFQGLIIWAFAIMLSLAFAFYLIDATVNLGLVGALMPFLIACWPFKITTGYTSTGIKMFLNSFFVFVFMGIVVSINMQLIGQAMQNSEQVASVTQDGGSASQGTASASSSGEQKTDTSTESGSGDQQTGSEKGGLSALVDALNSDDIDKLKELTDLGFGGFLILLCCCIFGFKFTSQATSLAENMAGGGISGIGNKIGGLAATGAGRLATKATQPARQAISRKANDLTSRAGEAVGKKLGIGKHGGKTGAKAGAEASANAGGGAKPGGNNAPDNKPAQNGGANSKTSPTTGRNLESGMEQGRNGGGNSGNGSDTGGNSGNNG